jgi:hypothetical protein
MYICIFVDRRTNIVCARLSRRQANLKVKNVKRFQIFIFLMTV